MNKVKNEKVKRWPIISKKERRALISILKLDDLSKERTLWFERLSNGWKNYIGVDYAIPCSSGTAALFLMLAGIDIKPGDEVIIPAFTWWATAAAIIQHQAIPIFVDIEENSFCLNPKKVKRVITSRTKAILAVHLHGYPADMNSLSKIAQKYNLFLLEDAAQAQGSSYFGKKTGSLGDRAAFSLEMSKLLTSGSVGGIMVTNNKLIYDNAMAACGFESGLGWGLRGDVFGQAFAVSQLEEFETRLVQRQKNCEYLSKRIEKIPGLKIQTLTKDIKHNYYNFVVELVAKDLNVPSSDLPAVRKKIVQKLNFSGLPAGLWEERSLPRYPIFKDSESYLHKFIIGKHNRRKVVYDASKYPIADKFSTNHFYINGINPPNGFAIMRRYADTIANILLENKRKLMKDEKQID